MPSPFKQKLRKIHHSLESLVKKALNKFLAAKIIFPVQHATWVANLVPVRKKYGENTNLHRFLKYEPSKLER
jgi:hypothetical protein